MKEITDDYGRNFLYPKSPKSIFTHKELIEIDLVNIKKNFSYNPLTWKKYFGDIKNFKYQIENYDKIFPEYLI